MSLRSLPDAEMTIRFLRLTLPAVLFLFVSCGVERNANFFRGGPAKAKPAEEENRSLAANPRAEAKLRREEARKAAAEAEAKAREAAERASLGRRQTLAASPEEADLMARAEAIAEKERKREAKRQAKWVAGRGSSAERPMVGEVEIPTEQKRGGWFSGRAFGKPFRKAGGDGHDIFVNHELLPSLDPSNARIEVALGEQRARVYHKAGPVKTLVIDTPVSSGKTGHETPTGHFTIGEKLVDKQSTLYGTWHDASGTPVPSSGESTRRPAGASQFVGADMPYWMRIHGGIGLHIGEVPGYPASHGCIRVPSSVQPLIYSKVGIGTPVTVMR